MIDRTEPAIVAPVAAVDDAALPILPVGIDTTPVAGSAGRNVLARSNLFYINYLPLLAPVTPSLYIGKMPSEPSEAVQHIDIT